MVDEEKTELVTLCPSHSFQLIELRKAVPSIDISHTGVKDLLIGQDYPLKRITLSLQLLSPSLSFVVLYLLSFDLKLTFDLHLQYLRILSKSL